MVLRRTLILAILAALTAADADARRGGGGRGGSRGGGRGSRGGRYGGSSGGGVAGLLTLGAIGGAAAIGWAIYRRRSRLPTYGGRAYAYPAAPNVSGPKLIVFDVSAVDDTGRHGLQRRVVKAVDQAKAESLVV